MYTAKKVKDKVAKKVLMFKNRRKTRMSALSSSDSTGTKSNEDDDLNLTKDFDLQDDEENLTSFPSPKPKSPINEDSSSSVKTDSKSEYISAAQNLESSVAELSLAGHLVEVDTENDSSFEDSFSSSFTFKKGHALRQSVGSMKSKRIQNLQRQLSGNSSYLSALTANKNFEKDSNETDTVQKLSSNPEFLMESEDALNNKIRNFKRGKVTRRAQSNQTLERKDKPIVFSQQKTPKFRTFKKIPVLLVTDIGADIDDTLALFVLLGMSEVFELICVVTSVNDGVARAALTRGWLRALGVSENVPILPSCDNLPAACHIPETFPKPEECNIGNVEDTPRRIVEICSNYRKNLILVGIAALTPIANAIKLDTEGVIKRAISRVYLQGHVFVHSRAKGNEKGQLMQTTDPKRFIDDTVYLSPNSLAYNFRNDMDSAQIVIDHLQRLVPFTFLGKFAAYKIGITKGDFNYLSNQSSFAKKMTENLKRPSLTYMAQCQMNNFRKGNPELFNRIYSIPEKYHHDLESMAWFEELPETGVCSHPYDPLLMMSMVEDHRQFWQKPTFTAAKSGLPALFSTSDTSDDRVKGSLTMSWFQRSYCFVLNEDPSKSKIMHTIIGYSEKDHGVPDVNSLHDELVEHIARGLRRN